MITHCPACDQLSIQDGRCYNPACTEVAPVPDPVTFSTVNVGGGDVVAVCSRCGAMVADWRTNRSRDGWPNQLRHARWHQQTRT